MVCKTVIFSRCISYVFPFTSVAKRMYCTSVLQCFRWTHRFSSCQTSCSSVDWECTSSGSYSQGNVDDTVVQNWEKDGAEQLHVLNTLVKHAHNVDQIVSKNGCVQKFQMKD